MKNLLRSKFLNFIAYRTFMYDLKYPGDIRTAICSKYISLQPVDTPGVTMISRPRTRSAHIQRRENDDIADNIREDRFAVMCDFNQLTSL